MNTGKSRNLGRCHELGVCQSLLAPSCPTGMCRRIAFERHQEIKRTPAEYKRREARKISKLDEDSLRQAIPSQKIRI